MNNAYKYKIYNLGLSIDNVLSKLYPTDIIKVDVQVLHDSLKKFDTPSHHFMTLYLPGGELWLSLAKMDGGYLVRFNGLADFFVSNDGHEIICMPGPEIPTETIQHLLLDQVIPLVINLKGGEALHVSAVLMPQGVVAFAGPAGSGKSTMVGSLLNLGFPLLSDDCLALIKKGEGIYGVPAYPGLRLWGDTLSNLFRDNGVYESVAHYTDKVRVDIERNPKTYCTEPQPLRRLYDIADSSDTRGKNEIVIEPLSSLDSFMALVRCAFRFDITDCNMLMRQFHFLKWVASIVSVRRLIFPRNFNLLPAVREAILNDLKDLDN